MMMTNQFQLILVTRTFMSDSLLGKSQRGHYGRVCVCVERLKRRKTSTLMLMLLTTNGG